MFQITISIEGMMCGMCEAHINDAIRKKLNPKKVTSSHKKKQTVIISEKEIPNDELRAIITEAGYDFISANHSVYKEMGLFRNRYKNM